MNILNFYKNNLFCKVSLFGLLMVAVTSSYAIDKGLHPIVTRLAIEEFDHCLNVLNKEVKPKFDVSTVSAYTKIEDEGPAIDRATNWHFHDQFHNKTARLKQPYFFMNASMHDIFDSRVKALCYVVNNDPLYEIDYDHYLSETKDQITGRILHYIQDVGVPAHVSPIYHSKPDGPFQTDFLKIPIEPDHFDELFTEDNIKNLDVKSLDVNACGVLYEKSKSMTLVQVLDRFAKETRDRVRTKINIAKRPNNTQHAWFDKSWEDIFWPIRTSDNRYEKDQYAHKNQGKNGFLKHHATVFKLESDNCGSTNNVCREFFKQQYISIRKNTVLALMIIYQHTK